MSGRFVDIKWHQNKSGDVNQAVDAGCLLGEDCGEGFAETSRSADRATVCKWI